MVRARHKARLARALAAVRGDRLIGHLTGASRAPLVVGYHRVVEDVRSVETPTIAPMSVSVQMFERQLDWIARRYRFVTLDELATRYGDSHKQSDPVAAITFDDGYADVYEHAFPVLMRKGIPAAVFVVTDWIGTSRMLGHDRLYRALALGWPRSLDALVRRGVVGRDAPSPRGPFETLRQLLTSRPRADLAHLSGALEEELEVGETTPASLRPLSWEMVRAMRRAGISVGSHTQNHPVLTCERATDVVAEVTGSRNTLQQQLGEEIRHFAYPDGAYDANTVKAVAEAGYQLAFTCCQHRNREHRLLTISRHLFWENTCLDARAQFSPAILSCLTNGVFDLWVGCRQTHRGPAFA